MDEKQCAWCGETYEVSELKKEFNLGYLCNKCIQAITSRGERLYFDMDDGGKCD